jgi:hypothetical protein
MGGHGPAGLRRGHIMWGLRSATCCRSARWAYAHEVLQKAPVVDDYDHPNDRPRLPLVGEIVSAIRSDLDKPLGPGGEAYFGARVGRGEGAPREEEHEEVGRLRSAEYRRGGAAWREGAAGEEEVQLVGRSHSPGTRSLRSAGGREPSEGGGRRVTTY